jgi:hypothetical protein
VRSYVRSVLSEVASNGDVPATALTPAGKSFLRSAEKEEQEKGQERKRTEMTQKSRSSLATMIRLSDALGQGRQFCPKISLGSR